MWARGGTRRRLRLRWSSFATEHASLHREPRVVDTFVRDVPRLAGGSHGEDDCRVFSITLVPVERAVTLVRSWRGGHHAVLVACAETVDEEVDFHEGRVNPAGVDSSHGRVEIVVSRVRLISLNGCGIRVSLVPSQATTFMPVLKNSFSEA